MCGFCGVVGPEASARTDLIATMARTLKHRGPDDFGTFAARFRDGSGEGAVGLGHTRLSILDLSPLGHQPMSSPDGSITVAYNGEIYNFRAIREELRARGSAFRSECDTEVLIEAYRTWDVDAFDRFVGMFAFAIWDAARRRLVLARDRLGIKPLYYQFRDGLLTFASEIRALREHPSFAPAIDREALAGFLQRGYVSGPATIYAGVRRLMPGEFLTFQGGRVETGSFWRLTDAAPEPPPPTFAGVVDELETRLGEAVEVRLIADVPLGAFLSGGIDSSAVVSLMVERATGRVRTFSIGFANASYDEAPFASAVARHLGTEHTELYVDEKQARQVARELPDLYDEPFGDSSAIPTVLLSRLTRQHVTVALSGDGGDELFGGYEHYRKLARLLPWLRVPLTLRRLLARTAPLVPHPSVRRALEHLAASTPRDVAEGLLRCWRAEELEPACGPGALAPVAAWRDAYDRAPLADPIRRAMLADARSYLPDDILTKVDRASMSVGLEARVPLLDHRVVRFASSLPLERIWHEGRSKAPLRALVQRRIPRELVDRPKRGFAIPLESLVGPDLQRWARRYLDPSRLSEEGLLEPEGVRHLVERARPFQAGGTSPLWFLICFERWFARNHRGEPLDL